MNSPIKYQSAAYIPFERTGTGHNILVTRQMHAYLSDMQGQMSKPGDTQYYATAIINAVNSLRASSSPMNSSVSAGSPTRRKVRYNGFEIEYDVNGDYYGGNQTDVIIISILPVDQTDNIVDRSGLWNLSYDQRGGWTASEQPVQSVLAFKNRSKSIKEPLRVGINGHCDGLRHAALIMPYHISKGNEEKLRSEDLGLFYVPTEDSDLKAGWTYLKKLGNSRLDKKSKDAVGVLSQLMKEAHENKLYVEWTSHRGGSQILTEAMKQLSETYGIYNLEERQSVFLSDYSSDYVECDRTRRKLNMHIQKGSWLNSNKGIAQIASGSLFGLRDLQYKKDELVRSPADERIGRGFLLARDTFNFAKDPYALAGAVGAAVVANGISGGLAVTLLSAAAAALATKAPNIAINSVPSLNEGFHTKDQPYIEAGKKIHKLIS